MPDLALSTLWLVGLAVVVVAAVIVAVLQVAVSWLDGRF